jgi:hypothetical protein
MANRKHKNRDETDLVEVHADTIRYTVKGDELKASTCDFTIYELGQRPSRDSDSSDARSTSVWLTPGISPQQAINELLQVVTAIKEKGLPSTEKKVSRDFALMLDRAQVVADTINSTLEKLPPHERQRLLPLKIDHNGQLIFAGLTPDEEGRS